MYYHWQNDTLILQVHLQPNAKQDEIVGVHGDYLKIRIKAPPTEGEANNRLIKFLAEQFDVPQEQIKLLGGKQSRYKRLAIKAPKKIINYE